MALGWESSLEAAGALMAIATSLLSDKIPTGLVPCIGGIESRIGAAAPRAPAASREDSHPQAILKFQPRSSFDYRVRYEPQLYYEGNFTAILAGFHQFDRDLMYSHYKGNFVENLGGSTKMIGN